MTYCIITAGKWRRAKYPLPTYLEIFNKFASYNIIMIMICLCDGNYY